MTGRVSNWRDRYEAFGGRLLVLTAWALPTAAVAVPHGASTIFTVVFLYALGTLAHLPARWRELERAERWLILAMLAFFLAPLASLVNADDLHEFGKRYERHVRFLGFITIFLLARAAREDLLRAVMGGCAVAGLAALGIAIHDLYWLDKPRAEGAYYAIIFGDMAALCGLLLVAWAAVGVSGLMSRLLWLVPALAAFCASALSGTRGAWVGIAVVLALLPLIVPRTAAGRLKALMAAAASMTVGAWLALQLPMVESRVEEVLQWAMAYLKGSPVPFGSQIRFELWRLAWDLWRAHPWVGVGFGDFPAFVEAALRGELDYDVVREFSHAHNVYLQFLASTGLTGFLAVLGATVAAPLNLAGAAVRRGLRAPGVTLVVFVAAFAAFGLTEDWTSRSPFTASFGVLLALLAAGVKRAKTTDNG
jgi:O-antigen ligase